MNIFIINKQTKTTEKTIPYLSVSKIRYDNAEYSKLMKTYDTDVHTVYLANSEYYDFEIVDGEVAEIKEEVVIVEKTEKEKEIERLNLELEKVQKALENPYRLLNGHRTLDEEIKILILKHKELSFELYKEEQI